MFDVDTDYFYHVTSRADIEQILKEGLKASIGPRSKLVNEKLKQVYLCRECDVPYWSIITGNTVCLRIDSKAVDTTKLSIADWGFLW